MEKPTKLSPGDTDNNCLLELVNQNFPYGWREPQHNDNLFWVAQKQYVATLRQFAQIVQQTQLSENVKN